MCVNIKPISTDSLLSTRNNLLPLKCVLLTISEGKANQIYGLIDKILITNKMWKFEKTDNYCRHHMYYLFFTFYILPMRNKNKTLRNEISDYLNGHTFNEQFRARFPCLQYRCSYSRREGNIKIQQH